MAVFGGAAKPILFIKSAAGYGLPHLRPSTPSHSQKFSDTVCTQPGVHVKLRDHSHTQVAALSTYRPKDVYRARQNTSKEWDWKNQKTKKYVKAGTAVLLSLGAVTAALLFKTIYDFEYNFHFFPDIFQMDRETDIYILGGPQGRDENEGRKKKKKSRILFPWLQSHSHDLWRLLRLAQSEDRSVRHMGVQSISEQHKWTDAECRMVAQALDSRTMIGLARTKGVDDRLFLPPPPLPSTQEDFESELRKLLTSLPMDNLDKCTRYFTSSALQEGSKAAAEERKGLVWSFDGNDFAQSQPDISKDIQQVVLFLQALQGHSQLASHCPLIVKLGGLTLMRRIHDLRLNSIKITRQIARVLANLAMYKELHDDIISAGWVTILSKWMKSGDFALTLHATKALANLDKDYGIVTYPDAVYLYYPQFRYREPVYADVVFIHGLLGGPFRTWRQNDAMKPNKTDTDQKTGTSNVEPKSSNAGQGVQKSSAEGKSSKDTPPYTFCWPKAWLSKDCPHIRIITVEYETHLSEWAPRCPYESEKRTILTRSRELLQKLKMAGLGDRPIIWVGHSMGGLLIKQMLLLANSKPSTRDIVSQSRGIVFYSVPHRGSPVAAFSTGNHSKFLLYPSVEVKELTLNSEQLLSLHKEFTELMFETGVPLLSFAEGEKTELPLNLKLLVVPTESSDPGFGEFHIMNDLNHLNICKPMNKSSPLYQMTLDFIRDCIPTDMVEHILKANLLEEYIFPEDLGEIHRE